MQAQVYNKFNRENFHKPFNSLNILGKNNKIISRININTDNRNSNATSHFSNNLSKNWKQILMYSNCPANQDGQPTLPPRKNADQPNNSRKKCKGSYILATCLEYQKNFARSKV